MVEIFKHHEFQRLYKGDPVQPKKLYQICNGIIELMGGHSLLHLQDKKKNVQLLQLPVQADLFKMEHYMFSTWCEAIGLKLVFTHDRKFILFCSTIPHQIPLKLQNYFNGSYAILSYGKRTLVFNKQCHPKHLIHKYHHNIVMANQNFKIWSQLTNTTASSYRVTPFRLFHFGDYEKDYYQLAIDIKDYFIKIGFGQELYGFFLDEISNYYAFGY